MSNTMKRLATAQILIVALLVVLLAVVSSPVFAIAPPDTAPAVNAVYVFDLSDGGIGVLVDYYLDYAVLPTETVTEAYLVVFIDTDGTTQLKAVAPYTYVDSGYGRGAAWIRFTAAEVASMSIDSADQALYRVWLIGNPTLTWTGTGLPKTITTIDSWQTTGDPEIMLALRVLTFADTLELAWSLDMIEETSLGSRLTTAGESYFMNVISNLRDLAPGCFSSGETTPSYEPMSYSTTFGATATSGTGTVAGSPVTLVDGTNTITVNPVGTVILDLSIHTFGTITNGTGIVTGSPVDLFPGVNTVTVTGAGDFTVDVGVTSVAETVEGYVSGTGFDLSTAATAFGMSRWMFSGLVWLGVTVIICAAVYGVGRRNDDMFGGSATKVIMLIFTACVIGGTLMGLLHPMFAAVMFVASGAAIGYILFFRSDSLHKGMMFMIWLWVITSIAGNILAGSMGFTATTLTVALDETDPITTITVASTEGFPESGYIMIEDEIIRYPDTTTTTFKRNSVVGVTTNPIVRGDKGTDVASHPVGSVVRTVEAGWLNSSLDYKIAQIADSAGIMGFVTLPFKLLDLLWTFFTLPIDFLGTDFALFTYIWAVISIGMLVGIALQLSGGRRV